ncbi:MAG: sulfur oxidation c-type cytochrome SoxX [Gammaproteobacteria bacterium]
MKLLKTLFAVVSIAGFAALPVASLAGEHGAKNAVDYTAMTPEALAEHLIFEAGGFKLDQPVQEGGVTRSRLVQDEIQKLCTPLRGQRPDPATAAKVMELAKASIKYPEGGIKLGDWKIGRELAWSGFGFRVGHRNDDHATAENGPGGNCYNCHQMATDRTGGTLGPPLTNFGKFRGQSEAMLKYAYDVIYNPNSVFACTNMPRIGANGVLTPEQISHVMAYIFDPESPVNK